MRSFLVGTLLPIGAIVIVALLEGALQAVAPGLSDRSVGFTNFSTIVQGVALLVTFFACGFFGPGLAKGWAAILWLLLPIVVLYMVAIIQQPYLYRWWSAENIGWTLFANAPFVLPLLATIIGYLMSRLRSPSVQFA